MADREVRECDECRSEFYADASAMAGLCPECAHMIYGYPNCEHAFVEGRCVKCRWDGSVSDFVRSLRGAVN